MSAIAESTNPTISQMEEICLCEPQEISLGAMYVWNRIAPEILKKHPDAKCNYSFLALYCELLAAYSDCKSYAESNKDCIAPFDINPWPMLLPPLQEALRRMQMFMGIDPVDINI